MIPVLLIFSSVPMSSCAVAAWTAKHSAVAVRINFKRIIPSPHWDIRLIVTTFISRPAPSVPGSPAGRAAPDWRPAHDFRITVDRRRPSNKEALHEIAAGTGEDLELGSRLDALGGHRKLEPACQSDNATQQGL